ncbi:MAG: nitroreductase, partial [Spartobacteria bacterium]|nr:nitroreductase [Spartobacteria bacterium]
MDFLDLVKQRYSVRGYTDAPVEEVLLNKVLQAGQQAPSAANRQPWHFVVVREKAKREAMLKAYAREWFSAAPVIIVVCVEPGSAWTRMDGKNYADVDGAIAMDHMTL